jgi:hypothetical protein
VTRPARAPNPEFDDCGCGCTPDTKPWPHTMIWGNCARAVNLYGKPALTLVDEYGHLMSGGGVHVWPLDAETLDIYPLAKRIEHGKRHGGTVLRRRIIVLDEWEAAL